MSHHQNLSNFNQRSFQLSELISLDLGLFGISFLNLLLVTVLKLPVTMSMKLTFKLRFITSTWMVLSQNLKQLSN